MSELPRHPDLDQLRRRARELHRAAQPGDSEALRRLRAVSGDVSLAAAQLAIAREHGFSGWPALKAVVEKVAVPSARTRSEPSLDDRVECSFCGKSRRQVKKLIAGFDVYICDECVGLCAEILENEVQGPTTANGRAGPGAVDRSNAPQIMERAEGVDVRVRLAERPGPWTNEYPTLARMSGLDAAVEEEPEGVLLLRVRLHGAFRDPEIVDALDRALMLVGDAKDQARTLETVADTTRRSVNRWWRQKVAGSSEGVSRS